MFLLKKLQSLVELVTEWNILVSRDWRFGNHWIKPCEAKTKQSHCWIVNSFRRRWCTEYSDAVGLLFIKLPERLSTSSCQSHQSWSSSESSLFLPSSASSLDTNMFYSSSCIFAVCGRLVICQDKAKPGDLFLSLIFVFQHSILLETFFSFGHRSLEGAASTEKRREREREANS